MGIRKKYTLTCALYQENKNGPSHKRAEKISDIPGTWRPQALRPKELEQVETFTFPTLSPNLSKKNFALRVIWTRKEIIILCKN